MLKSEYCPPAGTALKIVYPEEADYIGVDVDYVNALIGCCR
jgi:hypothetical protein